MADETREERLARQRREIRAWDNVGPSQNGRNAPYARRSRDTQRLRDMSDNDLRDAARARAHVRQLKKQRDEFNFRMWEIFGDR